MPTATKLKNWFIPHAGNRHHPHILKPRGLAAVAVLVVAIQVIFNFSVGHPKVLGYATDISTSSVIALTNQQRTANGLDALSESSQLDQAALANANYMFEYNYWAHVAPNGTQPWVFITNAGFSYTAAAQNLAKDFSTSTDVVDAWMASPEHRSNILNGAYNKVGVAEVNGTLQGQTTTLVVAFYATAAGSGAASVAAPVHSAPAATPAPTPVATSVPTAVPTPVATTAPKSTSSVGTASAAAKSSPTSSMQYILSGYTSVGWGRGLTTVILLALIALFGYHFWVVHRLPWSKKKHLAAYDRYPIIQIAFLLVLVTLLIVGAQGVIK